MATITVRIVVITILGGPWSLAVSKSYYRFRIAVTPCPPAAQVELRPRPEIALGGLFGEAVDAFRPCEKYQSHKFTQSCLLRAHRRGVDRQERSLPDRGDRFIDDESKFVEPLVSLERAELARLAGDETTRQRELHEAHRLFVEIGAPIRAPEVTKELGSATV